MPIYRSQVPLAPGATSAGPPPAFNPALGYGWAALDVQLYSPPPWWIDTVQMSVDGPLVSFSYPGVLSYVTTDINVDGTNTTDEMANISNAIAAAASGSASVWRRFRLVPSGGTTVRMTGALQVASKHHFILELNGCTLKTDSGAAFNQLTGGIVLGHAFGGAWSGAVNNFIITNGTLWQHNPSPGVFATAREQQANIEIAGGGTANACHDGLIYNMTLRGAGGDNLKLGGTDDLTYNIHGYSNNCIDCGRMHFTVIFGHDHTWGTLGANTHTNCGYACIDIEPNLGGTANDCKNIFVDGNTYGTWSQEFIAINGSGAAYAFDNIKVRNNLVTGSSLKAVMNNAAARPSNIEISGNVSQVSVAGPVLLCAHIDGLTIIHNTQPLSSGVLSSISDCTTVVSTPNP